VGKVGILVDFVEFQDPELRPEMPPFQALVRSRYSSLRAAEPILAGWLCSSLSARLIGRKKALDKPLADSVELRPII
jgi:hypothetical protein